MVKTLVVNVRYLNEKILNSKLCNSAFEGSSQPVPAIAGLRFYTLTSVYTGYCHIYGNPKLKINSTN